MHSEVILEIETLRRADLATLRVKHRQLFGEDTRCRHREHLFRRLAWRLQALAEGDLSERARQRAQQIVRDADLRLNAPPAFFDLGGQTLQTAPSDRTLRQRDTRLPVPGTLLSRQWKNRTILVEVLPQGFRYDNQLYSSLSAVALEVTGTRWNGLAFFGLIGRERLHGKR